MGEGEKEEEKKKEERKKRRRSSSMETICVWSTIMEILLEHLL